MTSTAAIDRQDKAAARWVRRFSGARALDELLRARGRDHSLSRLLQNSPSGGERSVQDGWDLLEARRAAQLDGPSIHRVGQVLMNTLLVLVLVLAGLGVVTIVTMSLAGPGDEGTLMKVLVVAVLTVIVLIAILGLAYYCVRGLRILSELRFAVRWAKGRPGQLERGLPVAEPFTALRGPVMAVLFFLWFFCGFMVLVVIVAAVDGTSSLLLPGSGIALVLFLVAAGVTRVFLMMGRASSVAEQHLVLLRARNRGLRVDAATAEVNRVLIVTEQKHWFDLSEVMVYPLTTRLPEDELRRRYEEGPSYNREGSHMLGDPGTVPLATIDNYTGEETALKVTWTEQYAGGWLVAEGIDPLFGEKVWFVMEDHPERFVDQILSQVGDRLRVKNDSVQVLEPLQLPGDSTWLKQWEKSLG